MNIKVELLTYEKGIKNEKKILQLMQSLSDNYGTEYCAKKTKDLISFLSDGSAIVATALWEDVVIGYAWGYLRNVKEPRIHVTQLVVDEECRSMGIGKMLLDFMMAECEKRECVGLELNVDADNKVAQQFYLNNHFVCESFFLSKEIKKKNTDI